MATQALTITIHIDTSDLSRATEKVIEKHIATAVEPVAKRAMRKALDELREEREATP